LGFVTSTQAGNRRIPERLIDAQDLDLGSLPTTEGFKINANLQPFLLKERFLGD
jgi:hypothetical protein